jgi:hypothetical protein
MENFSPLFGKLPYALKTLIVVNSIKYCYIELAINQHCALFGDNNKGKTSLLNVLKLHLFPENSFSDCKTKFSFKSAKGKLYSDEGSYNYYFPESSSFLILEAENEHGQFCIILSQSKRSLGYQRLVLPCSYEEIRHQFWNIEDVQTNNGLGSPVNDLSFTKIQTLYEQYKKEGALILTTTAEIKEKLFNHDITNRDKGRYCLVPLKDGGTEKELMTFRQLIKFSFEIGNADTKTLMDTFSTLIESDKTHSRDYLHQDLQQVLDEYSKLKADKEQLNKIENHRDNFNQLKDTYKNLTEKRQTFFNTYCAYENHLQEKQANLQNAIAPLQEKCEILSKQQKELEALENQHKIKKSELSGELKGLNRDTENYSEKIERYQKIKSESPKDFTNDSIRESLLVNKQELENKIKNLADRQSAINALNSKTQLKKNKIVLRNKKLHVVENWDSLFISQLSKHGSDILNHLNQGFKEIKSKPNAEQITAIENFSNLFSINENFLYFLNEKLDNEPLKSPEQIVQQTKQEIQNLDDEINKLDLEIRELNKSAQLSNENLAKLQQEHSKKLQETLTDLEIVNAIHSTFSEKNQKLKQVVSIETQIKELENQQSETKNLLSQSQSEYAATKSELDSSDKDIKTIDKSLQRLQNSHRDDLNDLQVTETMQINDVSHSNMLELETLDNRINTLNSEVNKKLNEFISSHDFQLLVEMQYEVYSHQTQQLILHELRDAFSELPVKKENLQSRIIEYNKMTGTKISDLKNNRDYINSFKNMINKELDKYHISNLQKIKIEIELDKRFEELINELDNANLLTTDLYNDALYQRLNEFCANFFTGMCGNNRILEMRKIINNIQYNCKIQNQDNWENEDQSTGTEALINCTLLTILLSKLLAPECKLTIPVVFDEFTKLGAFNQKTAVKTVKDHGFALFCASATDTPEVIAVVDYYIHLDECHVDTIYDKKGKRDIVSHPYYQERFYENRE